MHTALVMLGGLALLAVCLACGHLSGHFAAAALIFIPLWLAVAGLNLWIGVSRAGYTLREELPIFLLVFTMPSVIAVLVWWRSN
ncbi:hypothetical protein C2134_06475 [Chromobacterium sinusclupearum]|uniref:Transmembrane protein n=1 Tax=Chromobacterium sinusclupearum TaxID=2077146 RepID=A0A2K4MQY4_9NEIS|nr:hypothetical protein [Chromobacterium sinusclupearum]POA99409.1 hypothetical protein C2134_06475 [Chromobacterium sinusclupearum]